MAEYIEREKVLQILSERNAPWDAYVKVSQLKFADVAPVRFGKWIYGKDIPEQERKKNSYKYHPDCFYCSECYGEAYWDTDYGQQLFNYCPDCGAEMFKELQI